MMSDGMLSQDEIDALLRGSDNDNEEPLFVAPNVEDHFSTLEQDALGEIGNISFGSSATALSTLLNQKVEITTPMVSLLEKQQLEAEFPDPYVAIRVNYTEGFSGSNILVVEQRDAAIIADLMLGGNGENPSHEFDEIHLSAVQEAMNQMMGSAATSMSTVFSKKIDISPPAVLLIDFKEGEGKDQMPEDNLLVKVAFSIRIGRLIDSSIMQILPFPFAKELVKELLTKDRKAEEAVGATPNVPSTPFPKQEDLEQREHRAEDTSYAYSQHASENITYHQQAKVSQPAATNPAQTVNVQPAVFSNFETAAVAEAEPNNLNMLMDIPLQVTVELGRTRRSVKDILELSSGSVIELDKLAGEPVDILVNNKLIAQGEVVVIDESFGVRVTDIVSQTDRIKKLR
ncbi:flagellar motor switch protein FliN/FliY [Bacillus tianshenii]|uniref:Flagellar motor switch protein FliN/FliY n=1 Tax=Sutcliffiella tianshenii TaxID=1463404 RepID=A0ABS2NWK4_9BACI|nr:flagellar motor switch phosphatase FliY [Bacillus tianshenii]MBM7618997.1 flagellar motor switch protein FliN/FliY [Bacillus tianshenii]